MAQLRFQLNIRGVCVNWPLSFLSPYGRLNLHHHRFHQSPQSPAAILISHHLNRSSFSSVTTTPSYHSLAPPNRLPYSPSHLSITTTGEKTPARTNTRENRCEVENRVVEENKRDTVTDG